MLYKFSSINIFMVFEFRWNFFSINNYKEMLIFDIIKQTTRKLFLILRIISTGFVSVIFVIKKSLCRVLLNDVN